MIFFIFVKDIIKKIVLYSNLWLIVYVFVLCNFVFLLKFCGYLYIKIFKGLIVVIIFWYNLFFLLKKMCIRFFVNNELFCYIGYCDSMMCGVYEFFVWMKFYKNN